MKFQTKFDLIAYTFDWNLYVTYLKLVKIG
jgi:hypothetical protein